MSTKNSWFVPAGETPGTNNIEQDPHWGVGIRFMTSDPRPNWRDELYTEGKRGLLSRVKQSGDAPFVALKRLQKEREAFVAEEADHTARKAAYEADADSCSGSALDLAAREELLDREQVLIARRLKNSGNMIGAARKDAGEILHRESAAVVRDLRTAIMARRDEVSNAIADTAAKELAELAKLNSWLHMLGEATCGPSLKSLAFAELQAVEP